MRLLPLLFLWACEPAADERLAPELYAARPEAARPGQAVTLLGRNLGLDGPRDGLQLGGVGVPVLRWTDTAIELRLPAEYPPGVFDWVVRSGAQVSRPLAFEVLPQR